MAPRISVCRKGDDIFLTVKGSFNNESVRELLLVVRQLLMTSLKCAAPGSQVTFNLRTRGKVDLEKMFHLQHSINDQTRRLEACVAMPDGQEPGEVKLQEESPESQPRNGLFLVKGGVL